MTGGNWTFLTNYAHILLCIAEDPGIRLRDAADRVGITERAVQRIVADLIEAGYLEAERDGRRNHYRVNPELPLRHPVEQHNRVAALLSLISQGREGKPTAKPRREARPSARKTPRPV